MTNEINGNGVSGDGARIDRGFFPPSSLEKRYEPRERRRSRDENAKGERKKERKKGGKEGNGRAKSIGREERGEER